MSDEQKSHGRRSALKSAALLLAGAGAGQTQTKDAAATGKQSAGGAIRSGHLLFLSGIGGWYPERRPKAGDVRQQTGDALTMMKAALEKAGTSMDSVLKAQVALVDPEHNWEGMNEVYNTFFKDPRPARSYFGATGFRHPGQLLQIDCIAYIE
jgi:enamine deaminase RidA (YjgF/YER057c/UK114 family)